MGDKERGHQSVVMWKRERTRRRKRESRGEVGGGGLGLGGLISVNVKGQLSSDERSQSLSAVNPLLSLLAITINTFVCLFSSPTPN